MESGVAKHVDRLEFNFLHLYVFIEFQIKGLIAAEGAEAVI